MKDIKKIAIIGVGFMGGSLALAFKAKFPAVRVCGFARNDKSYNKLKKLNLLDEVGKDLKGLVFDADLVIFGLPVELIIEYFKKVSPFLKKGAVVIDLGSTKQSIERSAKKILPSAVSFVGCHPLAGSEKSGAQFSRPDLYQGSVCLITASNQSKAAKLVRKIWQSLGCQVFFLGALEHDKMLSAISHLPHLISFSFSGFASKRYLRFSTASFKDLTRIAHSPAEVWVDIFLSNKKNILTDLKGYLKVLKKFESLLKKGNRKGMLNLINRSKIK